MPQISKKIYGSILGMAVGDALGLPYEGMSANFATRFLGPPERHRLCCGRGMISDDTEHAILVLKSFLDAPRNGEQFQVQLRKRLGRWLLTLPTGIGLATLKSCLKMCMTPSHWPSGVFSAGNGPAMRAPIIALLIEDTDECIEYVRISTELTHTDPKALYGAITIAVATRMSANKEPISGSEFFHRIDELLPDNAVANELRERLMQAMDLDRFKSVQQFATETCSPQGVSGYIYETVPFIIHCWLRFPTNYPAAIQQAILSGGDTDTTAAILGGIIGARVPVDDIPKQWRDRLILWPFQLSHVELMAVNAESQLSGESTISQSLLPHHFFFIARNLVMIIIVLSHVVIRLLASPLNYFKRK